MSKTILPENLLSNTNGNYKNSITFNISQVIIFSRTFQKIIANKFPVLHENLKATHLSQVFPCRNNSQECSGFYLMPQFNTIKDAVAYECACKKTGTELETFLLFGCQNFIFLDLQPNTNQQLLLAWNTWHDEAEKNKARQQLLVNRFLKYKQVTNTVPDIPLQLKKTASDEVEFFNFLHYWQDVLCSSGTCFLSWTQFKLAYTTSNTFLNKLINHLKNCKLIILDLNDTVLFPANNSSAGFDNRLFELFIDKISMSDAALIVFSKQPLLALDTNEISQSILDTNYNNQSLTSFKDANQRLRFVSTKNRKRAHLPILLVIKQGVADKLIEILARGQLLLENQN